MQDHLILSHLQLQQMDPLALRSVLIGLEKEALRVTASGELAQTPHPAALGSALSNPYVTTDFSEALLELVSPALPTTQQLLDFCEASHQFTYRALDKNELIWCASMPCTLGDPAQIPIANYGRSNIGMMKTICRSDVPAHVGTAAKCKPLLAYITTTRALRHSGSNTGS